MAQIQEPARFKWNHSKTGPTLSSSFEFLTNPIVKIKNLKDINLIIKYTSTDY